MSVIILEKRIRIGSEYDIGNRVKIVRRKTKSKTKKSPRIRI